MNRQQRRAIESNRRKVANQGRANGPGPWVEQSLERLHSPEGRSRWPALRGIREAWRNGHYIVYVEPLRHPQIGLCTRLWVQRVDKKPVRAWADLQAIKNHFCGPERVAIEFYPPESRLVDTHNIYHLWVLPEGAGMPFDVGRDSGLSTGPEGGVWWQRLDGREA